MMKMMAAVALLSASPLYAQELTTPMAPSPVKPAARNAFELMLGLGYGQGFGSIGNLQPKVNDLLSAGGEVQLGLGWRINPRFMVGVFAQGSKNSTRDLDAGGDVYTAGAGIETNYHFLPGNDWDPWMGLATGWRGLWVSQNGTDSWQGIGTRLTIGVDYRISSDFAMGPYLSGGANTYFHQDTPSSSGSVNGRDFNFWLSAGIQARFDVTG